ncbi:IS110 family transposase [Bacillus aquiflavi]|uniref:IS110 family transposase n=1 Tax=Bacillus aquiflavi TaxID=2672567 RepID=UPI00223AC2BF|nr:IS110 family transposase [Bacillus aquiflavi]
MSQMLVGVDVSLKSHHVHFMKQDGSTLADFSVSNDKTGGRNPDQTNARSSGKKSGQPIEDWDGSH